MAALPRSEISFRRSGSSGLVWDDKLLSGQLIKTDENKKEEEKEITTEIETNSSGLNVKIERSRSNGGHGFRTGKVSPAIEPPSPKVSACGFCSAFGNTGKKTRRRQKTGKRVM